MTTPLAAEAPRDRFCICLLRQGGHAGRWRRAAVHFDARAIALRWYDVPSVEKSDPSAARPEDDAAVLLAVQSGGVKKAVGALLLLGADYKKSASESSSAQSLVTVNSHSMAGGGPTSFYFTRPTDPASTIELRSLRSEVPATSKLAHRSLFDIARAAHAAVKPAHIAVKTAMDAGRRSVEAQIKSMLHEVDPECSIEGPALKAVRMLVENFVDQVTQSASELARHRESGALAVRDVECCLKREWGIEVVGFTPETSSATRLVATSEKTGRAAKRRRAA